MAQTRGTFTELHDNLDRTVFTLLGKEWKEQKPIWRRVYNVKDSGKRSELITTVTGVGDVPEKGEGMPYATDVIKVGYTKEFLHTEFGLMFEVSQTALEDDRYDVLSDHAKWFMFSARVVEEKRAALLFNNGFGSEQSPDGVSIFNATHVLKGGGTARNILASAADLSWTSLQQALVDWQRETKFEAGQNMMPVEDLILFVPPELEFTAAKIVNSTLQPGVADNDLNTIKTLRNISVVKNVYLTDTDAWFLLSSTKSQHGFCSYTRVAMSMEPAMTDPRTRNRLYPIRFRRSWGNKWWQNSFGTAGA
jgi:hypothetical protein